MSSPLVRSDSLGLLLGAAAALALLLHAPDAAAQRAPLEGARGAAAGGPPAALFAAIGTAHGSGAGAAQFSLPDYRGRFLRGVDHGANRDPDASRRTAASGGGNLGDAVGSVQGERLGRHPHQSLDGPATGTETRPVNAAVHWIVKE